MRAEGEMSRPGSSGRRRFSRRWRVIAIAVVAAFIILIISLRGIAGFYTDYLWFDSLGYDDVWRRVLLAKIVLALIFIGVFFVVLWTNLFIADRIAPTFRPPGPEEEILSRYHMFVGRRTGLVRLGVALFFAVVSGVGASGQWRNWILFTNRVDFGLDDPQFDTDIGFYVFQLPFLDYVVGWLFTALVIIFIVTAVAHYVNGGIRVQTPGQRVTPQVKAHLSVLLGLLALVRAGDYYLDRFGLVTSSNGTVDGATYTDVNARLPVLNLLILISLFAFVLLLVNIRLRGWVLPTLAVGLWLFVSVVMGGIYPLVIQRFQVEPDESTKEAEFIDLNIAATRAALGLDDVVERRYAGSSDLTYQDILDNSDIFDAVPLLDRAVLPETFENLEGERPFYQFPPQLDVDRYEIDGETTPVVLGARQLDPAGIPNASWERERLTFTHGFGLAIAPANRTDAGEPDFVVRGLPIVNDLDVPIDQPRIYFGEDLGGYAIVNTDRNEVDGAEEQSTYTYDGEGGVEMGGFFRKAAFALRFGDIDPLISNFVQSDSRIIYNRDIRGRISEIAPFLHLDSDIYPVISEGRIVYVADAFTTTNRYPYAQQADTEQLPEESGLRHDFNYVRNSVKVVVDAFDGTVTFYVFDETDPIIQAWRDAFPELFSDLAEMPADILDHVRYPEDLFRVQTNVYARYQLDDAQDFYEQAEGWAVAQDPGGVDAAGTTDVTAQDGTVTARREERIEPYYTLLRLPEEEESDFVSLRSFVPVDSSANSRRELTAFMVANSDADEYGQLIVYEIDDTRVDGPALVNSRIQSDQGVSRVVTLLDQQGSDVRFGDLLLVPVGESIVYVRAMYVIAEATEVPVLRNVVAVIGNDVVMCRTLDEALEGLFGRVEVSSDVESVSSGCVGTVEGVTDADGGVDGDPDPVPDPSPTPTPEPPTTSTTTPGPTPTPTPTGDATVEELLSQAEELFARADEALESGDLGGYQDLVDDARRLVMQARTLTEGDVGDSEPT